MCIHKFMVLNQAICFEIYQLYFTKHTPDMLSTAYTSQMGYNRKFEKKIKHFNLLNIQNNEDYFCVSVRLLQVRNLLNFDGTLIKTSFQHLISQSQYCEQCGLKKQTKYLAKKNFDTYNLMHPYTSKERLQFVAMSLLRLAIHYNEDPSIYDQITIQFCVIQCENTFSADQFKAFELGIFMQEEFRLDFTSTYDYLGTYLLVFELTEKQIKWIKQVLDFSYAIPQLTLCLAEQIFFAALVLLNEKSEQQTIWILNQTHYPSEVLNTYKTLRQAVYSLSAQSAQSQ